MADSTVAWPVSMMTSGGFGRWCTRLKSSMPSRFGIAMSESSTSTLLSSRSLRAASPSGATRTSWPIRCSSFCRTSRRLDSSSATRILAGCRFSLNSVSLSVRLFRRGQRNAEDRPAPDGRVDRDATAVLRNNTITDGESETGAAPDLLGREERVEDALAYLHGDALPRVAHLDRDRAALFRLAAQRAERERAALRHRVHSVLGEDDDGLLQLPHVAGDERQALGQLDINPDVDAALLVREQTRRRLDDFGEVDGRVLGGSRAAEVQQAVRNLLGAEGLAADELKVFAQVSDARARAVDALGDARLQRLGARRDGRERVVDLVDDARRQPPDRRELLGARHGAVGLDARGDVLADRDDVRDLLAVRPHRHFADEPVARRAVGRFRLLLDALDLAGLEGALEFSLQGLARLARQHVEDVPAQNVAARDALPAQLAVAVPGDDAVFVVNRVERDGKAVNDRLREAALRFGLGCPALDLAREVE